MLSSITAHALHQSVNKGLCGSWNRLRVGSVVQDDRSISSCEVAAAPPGF